MRQLTKIFDAFIRFVAWLLLVLGLWVPFLYTFVFVIVCALYGIKLNDLLPLFFVGFVISCICSVVIVFSRPFKGSGKSKKPASIIPPIKKKERLEHQPAPTMEQHSYMQAPQYAYEPVVYRQEAVRQEPPLATFAAPPPITPFHPTQAAPQAPPPPPPPPLQKEQQSTTVEQPQHQVLEPILTQPQQEEEKPMIFRTRLDPSKLIYEYSNKIEVYEITQFGLVRISTQYK